MAIEDLFDHRVRVWRPAQGRGAYAEVVDGYELVEEGGRVNAAIVPAKMSLEDAPPGERTGGRVHWFLGLWVDVTERDIIECFAGPNAPSTWKVHSVTVPSGRLSLGVGGHHIEPVVEPWIGDLPSVEEQS